MMNGAECSSSLSAKDKLSSAAQTYSVSGYCRSEQMVYCSTLWAHPRECKISLSDQRLYSWQVAKDVCRRRFTSRSMFGRGTDTARCFSVTRCTEVFVWRRSTTFRYKHLVYNHPCSEKRCIKMAAKYGSVARSLDP